MSDPHVGTHVDTRVSTRLPRSAFIGYHARRRCSRLETLVHCQRLRGRIGAPVGAGVTTLIERSVMRQMRAAIARAQRFVCANDGAHRRCGNAPNACGDRQAAAIRLRTAPTLSPDAQPRRTAPTLSHDAQPRRSAAQLLNLERPYANQRSVCPQREVTRPAEEGRALTRRAPGAQAACQPNIENSECHSGWRDACAQRRAGWSAHRRGPHVGPACRYPC